MCADRSDSPTVEELIAEVDPVWNLIDRSNLGTDEHVRVARFLIRTRQRLEALAHLASEHQQLQSKARDFCECFQRDGTGSQVTLTAFYALQAALTPPPSGEAR